MARLKLRLVALERASGGQHIGTRWGMVRWRHPLPGRGGFVCGRGWGWELRDLLGWQYSEEVNVIVSNESAGDHPFVLVEPKMSNELTANDVALLEPAIGGAGPWWLFTMRGAYVFGDPLPNGVKAYIAEHQQPLQEVRT